MKNEIKRSIIIYMPTLQAIHTRKFENEMNRRHINTHMPHSYDLNSFKFPTPPSGFISSLPIDIACMRANRHKYSSLK